MDYQPLYKKCNGDYCDIQSYKKISNKSKFLASRNLAETKSLDFLTITHLAGNEKVLPPPVVKNMVYHVMRKTIMRDRERLKFEISMEDQEEALAAAREADDSKSFNGISDFDVSGMDNSVEGHRVRDMLQGLPLDGEGGAGQAAGARRERLPEEKHGVRVVHAEHHGDSAQPFAAETTQTGVANLYRAAFEQLNGWDEHSGESAADSEGVADLRQKAQLVREH